MGNCCHPEKNQKDNEAPRQDDRLPMLDLHVSQKNSMIQEINEQLGSKSVASKEPAKGLLASPIIGSAVQSFASNSQQMSQGSPQDTACFSSSKQNLLSGTNCSSFFSAMQPYKDKDMIARIQQQSASSSSSTFSSKSNFSNKKFFVITTIYTPSFSSQKVEIYKNFEATMEAQGCRLITIEFASLSSPFLVTDEHFQPYHFQVRLEDPLSLKFNAINQILKRLPDNWSWIALIDYNVQFENVNWITDAEREIDSHRVVQLFSSSVSSSPSFPEKPSLALFLQQNRQDLTASVLNDSIDGGRAWAFRKDFFKDFSHFPDVFISGFEETMLSLCLAGLASKIFTDQLTVESKKLIQKFEKVFNAKDNKNSNSQSCIKGRIRLISFNFANNQEDNYGILQAVSILNVSLSCLFTDSLKQIHVKNSQLSEQLKSLNKYLL